MREDEHFEIFILISKCLTNLEKLNLGSIEEYNKNRECNNIRTK